MHTEFYFLAELLDLAGILTKISACNSLMNMPIIKNLQHDYHVCLSLQYVFKWHALEKINFTFDKIVQVDELTINLEKNYDYQLSNSNTKTRESYWLNSMLIIMQRRQYKINYI